MTLRMPVVFGSTSFARVFNAVENATSKGDFPIELDCCDLQLATSSFYMMVVGAMKRMGGNRDKLVLINVSNRMRGFMRDCKFDQVVNIRMADG